MFKRFWNWLTGTRKQSPSTRQQLDAIEPTKTRSVFTINRDEMSSMESAQLPRLLADQAKLPVFEGTIKHVYDLAFVEAATVCPRCHASTQQKYANWVYATDRTPRAMAAPAGYFCTKCPTVVVDQEMLAEGVARGFTYVQVIGLTNDDNQDFQDFTTWNGQKPIYLFDENGNPSGLATPDELTPEERRVVKAQKAKARPKRMKVKRK
ncbi:MAG: hypothetical protein ACOYNY_21835 [Caldilineaceae bacterium]